MHSGAAGVIALAGMDMLTYRYTNEEDGKTLRRYWTSARQTCALKAQCTPGKERRISPWEHEAVAYDMKRVMTGSRRCRRR
jgi:hypothetical protein